MDSKTTYINNVQGFLNRFLGVEGVSGIDFGGNLSGNDLEDLGAEFHQQSIQCVLYL